MPRTRPRAASGASPVNVSTSAPSTATSPRPPASTTPARPRTASWPGVAASAAEAPSYAALATVPQSPSASAGGVGRGGGDREDRALDRVGHGLPGGVGRVPQGQAQAGTVDVSVLAVRVGGGQHLGHAAQQLRQDRAGVAARAYQRAVGHRAGRVGQGRRAGGAARSGPVSCPAKAASTAAHADSSVR